MRVDFSAHSIGHRWQRAELYLNHVRWLVLSLVFLSLILLPLLHVYQTFVAAHAYDHLLSWQKTFYDLMQVMVRPFTTDPELDLNLIKGSTWSLTLFGLQVSDPLAVLSQIMAEKKFYWPFALTAIFPVLVTVLLGRVFCGWICPATFLYELNSNLAALLHRKGFPVGHRIFDRRLKYALLAMLLIASTLTGATLAALFYPPAVIGRELYLALAAGGFGGGVVLILMTLLFDLLVARRGFCRYVCPGGALYSLLGRFRLLRIQRDVSQCNDCAKCNAVCEFGLHPMQDQLGRECNNCTACVSICPTHALHLQWQSRDQGAQGPGHLGSRYRKLDFN